MSDAASGVGGRGISCLSAGCEVKGRGGYSEGDIIIIEDLHGIYTYGRLIFL